jgi:DNA polymerase-3 subunit beta
MKISIQKQELHRAINIVSKAATGKIPQLESILFQADENLTLTGNNLEIGIKTNCIAVIYEKGEICINAKLLLELINKMPNSLIEITVTGDNINIKCENINVDIMGLSSEGYPYIEIPQGEKTLSIQADELKTALSSVLFACATTDIKPILTGVHFDGPDKINLVSVDGYRLAKIEIDMQADINCTIPATSLNELIKIISGDVDITITDKQAVFNFDDCVFITRLLDGEFINYAQFFKNDCRFTVEPDISQLKASIERATVLVQDTPIQLELTDGQMKVKSGSGKGKYEDILKCDYEGETFTIGFNSKYILDALKICGDDSIFRFTGNINPLVIDSENWKGMVVPVRLK